MSTAAVVSDNKELAHRINNMEVRPWHWKLVFLCMIGVMIENFDAMSLSMAMPIITRSWSMEPRMIGVLLSATSLGLLIGAIVFGILADVIGRKKSFILTTAIFTFFVCISVFVQNFSQLYLLRVLAGLGMGGFIPVGMAYVSEFAPARVRGRFIGIYSIGNGIGYVIAVITSMLFVQKISDSWRIVFGFGGIIGIIILPILFAALPESVSWLMSKGRTEEAIRTVETIEKKALGEVTVSHEEAVKLAGMTENNAGKKKHETSSLTKKDTFAALILSMVLWFVSSYTFFGFIQWMPTFLTENMNYSLTKGYWFTLVSALIGTGTPGIAVGFASDYIGKKWTLAVCMLSYAAASMMFLWFGGWWLLPLYWFSSAMSSQLYIYTPQLFPPAFRGSGLGFSSSVGRIAQFLAPMLIGLSVAQSGLAGVIYVNVAMLVVAVLFTWVLGQKETRSKAAAQKAE